MTKMFLVTSLLVIELLGPSGGIKRSTSPLMLPHDADVLSSICKSRCFDRTSVEQESSCLSECHSLEKSSTSQLEIDADCPLPRTCRMECIRHRQDETHTDESHAIEVNNAATIYGPSKLSQAEILDTNICLQTCCSRVLTDLLPSPIIVRNNESDVLLLDWSDALGDVSEDTLLFHVQRSFENSSVKTWKDVHETYGKYHWLSTEDVTNKYRIWATSSTRFLGISLDSLREEDGATAPSPPRNLTEGDTLLSDGNISVFIFWSPPQHSNPPVSKYNVIWTKKSSFYEPKSSHRRSVPASHNTFQLPNLEQSASYLVQVQAVSKFGKKRLKSSKSSIIITTYPIPFAPFTEEHLFILSSTSPTHHNRHHHQLHAVDKHQNISFIVNMTLGRPYYESANLKVGLHWNLSKNFTSHSYLVTWYPDACIVDDSSKMQKQRNFLPNTLTLVAQNHSAVLHSLSVNCRYTVKVEATDRHFHSNPEKGQGRDEDDESKIKVESEGRQSVTPPSNQISFSTPSCGNSKNMNIVDNQLCIDTDVLLPDKVRNLEYRFLISGSSNVTCRVSWKSPSSQSQILGYRVSWVPVSSQFPMNEVLFKVDGDEHPFLKTLFNDDDLNEYDDDGEEDNENADDDSDDGRRDADEDGESSYNGARKRSSFLDHTARNLDIRDLLVETTYVLRVRAVSSDGPGKASYIHFTMPYLQTGSGRWRGNSARKESSIKQQQHHQHQTDDSTGLVKSPPMRDTSFSSSSSFPSLSNISLLRTFLCFPFLTRF